MKYENNKTRFFFCLESKDQKRYTKTCVLNRECQSNKCEKIFDNGKDLGKKCIEAKERDPMIHIIIFLELNVQVNMVT